MTYEDAVSAQDITRKEALREVAKHHADKAAFLSEVGDKETYTGAEVLGWLGY